MSRKSSGFNVQSWAFCAMAVAAIAEINFAAAGPFDGPVQLGRDRGLFRPERRRRVARKESLLRGKLRRQPGSASPLVQHDGREENPLTRLDRAPQRGSRSLRSRQRVDQNRRVEMNHGALG